MPVGRVLSTAHGRGMRTQERLMRFREAEIHPSGLVARLGLFTAVMIIIGNMIGSGIFKKTAPMAEQVQSPG